MLTRTIPPLAKSGPVLVTDADRPKSGSNLTVNITQVPGMSKAREVEMSLKSPCASHSVSPSPSMTTAPRSVST